MRIVHLSSTDGVAGAARAAHRLHTGLRAAGHDSRIIVSRREGDDPHVVAFRGPGSRWGRVVRRLRQWQTTQKVKAACANRAWRDVHFTDDRGENGRLLLQQVLPCDVINLHWTPGLLDYRSFFRALPPRVPVVWRLADMNPMTGGCHLAVECERFKARCGACPLLRSTREHDLSRQIWSRKHAALASLRAGRLHLVATSRWIAGEAARSSLLGGIPTTVIPNGLDTEVFRPLNRAFARTMLGIPAGARVVLFVAHTLTNPLKGLPHLLRALEPMDKTERPLLVTVGRRAWDIPNVVPCRHLGPLSDDVSLAAAYSAADVFAMPSLMEPFGQTVIEALSCGTPVVGFQAGGVADTVTSGLTGYTVEPGNTGALGAALLRVLALDPAERALMSSDCRAAAVREYALPVQAARYISLYESLLGSRNGGLD